MAVRESVREFVRRSLRERDRMLLSRLSLAAGLRPRINRAAPHRLPLPGGRRAAVVLSADLELAWAWRYARGVDDPLALSQQRARQGRRNLARVLDLCDRYQLPITWAVVGHLFLDQCTPTNGIAHPEVPRVPHFENELWAYRTGDWFEHDPGLTDQADEGWADWYGPDLIRDILDRSVAHEIGCHTFSHAVFSDRYCPPGVAAAELDRCQAAAFGALGRKLRSFVFTGNLEGNHGALRDAGFRIYRVDDWYDLDIPRRDEFGLWRMNGGICLDRPYADGRASDHLRLLKRCLDVAIERGQVCGFWFHPETEPRDVEEIFTALFEYIAQRRDELWITTMSGMADWLDTVAAGSAPRREQAANVNGVSGLSAASTAFTPTRTATPLAYVGSLFDTGLAAVRALGRAGVPVVGLDSDPSEPGFKSRYGRPLLCPDPVHDPDALADFLVELGRKAPTPGVLLPASDAWVLFISRYRDRLADYFRFALPSHDVVEALLDKRRQYELAERVGTPYPRTFYPTSLAEARQVAEEVEFPAFLKPYYGHLWRETFGGTHKGFKVHTPAELMDRFALTLSVNQQVMVQSIVLGPNTNHYKVCAYIAEDGQALALFTLRKLRQYPIDFGVGTLVESIHDDALAELGLEFLRGIDYRGIGSIEFKRDDRDGKLKLIELNPRLWQQHGQAAGAGINFPLIAYLDLIGKRPQPISTFPTGFKWLDANADAQAAWEYFRRGQLSPWQWLRSLSGVRSFATFAFDDLRPFLSTYEYGAKGLRLPLYLFRHSARLRS